MSASRLNFTKCEETYRMIASDIASKDILVTLK